MKNRKLIYLIFTILLNIPIGKALSIDDIPWKKSYVKDEITIYTKKIPGSDILAFKAKGIINAPIGQVMEVLRKVEISTEWMPGLRQKRTLKEISDLEAITYSINKIPWPFSDRELILHNKLWLDRVNKSVVVHSYSIDFKSQPPNPELIRAIVPNAQTTMKPTIDGRTKIELTIMVNPNGSIPTWLVNSVQKSMPFKFLKSLEKKARTSNYPLRPSFQKVLNDLQQISSENWTAMNFRK